MGRVCEKHGVLVEGDCPDCGAVVVRGWDRGRNDRWGVCLTVPGTEYDPESDPLTPVVRDMGSAARRHVNNILATMPSECTHQSTEVMVCSQEPPLRRIAICGDCGMQYEWLGAKFEGMPYWVYVAGSGE